MTFDAFLAALDHKNSFIERFVRHMRAFNPHNRMLFARKGRNLAEVVDDFCTKDAAPIVDKRMQMVLGVGDGFHHDITALLYNYHTSRADMPDLAPAKKDHAATGYIMDGMGYFISSMRKGIIVCGTQYQEDRLDKDLFLMHKVDRTL